MKEYHCESCRHIPTEHEINFCLGFCPKCGRDSLVIKNDTN
jgi:Zn finger protein HypA/HybF involved in hydrogenase expression